MKAHLKKKWIDALRSGEYLQGQGKLRRKYPDGHETFCCLGVLCEVMGSERKADGYNFDDPQNPSNTSFPQYIVEELGLDKYVKYDKEAVSLESKLISLNDDCQNSFQQIANYLERVNF